MAANIRIFFGKWKLFLRFFFSMSGGCLNLSGRVRQPDKIYYSKFSTATLRGTNFITFVTTGCNSIKVTY